MRFHRGNNTDLFSHDKVFKSRHEDYTTTTATAPAAAASLPSVGGVQEFTDLSPVGSTIICAGTWLKIGDTWGCLLHDVVAASTNATYVTGGGIVRMNVNAGGTYSNGIDMYMTIATGVGTEVDGGATEDYIGVARSGALTNPDGLPTGTYVDVYINQTEK